MGETKRRRHEGERLAFEAHPPSEAQKFTGPAHRVTTRYTACREALGCATAMCGSIQGLPVQGFRMPGHFDDLAKMLGWPCTGRERTSCHSAGLMTRASRASEDEAATTLALVVPSFFSNV